MTVLSYDRSKGFWLQATDWEKLTGGLPVYRGFTRPLADDKVTLVTPTKRLPKNIPVAAHNSIDDWFYGRFGVKFRTQAVYGTGSLEKAIEHAGSNGEVAIIRPNSDFLFCWSPHGYDLLGEYAQLEDDAQINDLLEKLAFTTDHLDQAVMSGHEIMLAADS